MVNTRRSCKGSQDESVQEQGRRKFVYDEANLKAAVTHIIEKRLSYREASAYYNITRSTLQRKVKSILNGEQVTFTSNWGNYKPTFNEIQGEQLYKYLKLLEQRQIRLTKRDFLSVAFEFAERMKINHRFNHEKKMAGETFYQHFMKRYPDLKFYRISSLDDRNVSFAEKINSLVDEFIGLLTNHIFDPIYIFNETGARDENGNNIQDYNDKI